MNTHTCPSLVCMHTSAMNNVSVVFAVCTVVGVYMYVCLCILMYVYMRLRNGWALFERVCI